MVESAPDEKIHGCVGCQITSNTPKSSCCLWVCSFFSGTINGFCNKSLQKREEWSILMLNATEISVRVQIHTCKPFHVTQSPIDRHWLTRTVDTADGRPHFVRHSCASVSFDMALSINLNQTKASSCRTWTPVNCRLLDVLPYPKSICYSLSTSSIALVSLNRKCEHSFVSANGIRNGFEKRMQQN